MKHEGKVLEKNGQDSLSLPFIHLPFHLGVLGAFSVRLQGNFVSMSLDSCSRFIAFNEALKEVLLQYTRLPYS